MNDTFKVGEQSFEYPLLVRRYKAVLIDVLVLLIVVTITLFLTSSIQTIPVIFKILYLIVLLSYEPVLTTYKSTLGQYILKIRIRKNSSPTEKINLLQAYIRVIVKGILGWFSFLTINFNDEHRAIHDYAASSVVIIK